MTSTEPPDPLTMVLTAFAAATPRCGSTKVLAIDGPSGSGKTQLAGRVAGALGLTSAQVVHMDRIYPGWDGLAAGVDALADGVLAPLADGRPGAYRTWDWLRNRWRAAPVEVPVGDVLLVEGCGANAGRAGRYAALRVWVDAPPDVRYRRAMARDGDTYRPHWDRWAAQEEALDAAGHPGARADVRVWMP